MVVSEAITSFEIYLLSERCLAKNTVYSYLGDLRQFDSYLCKKKILVFSQINVSVLKKYLKHLRSKLQAGPRSMSRKISTIKSFFKFVSQKFDLPNLATSLVFPKLQKKLPHFLSEEEIEKLLEHAAADNTDFGIRNRVMLTLLYVTGMRISELIDLRIHSIQFDDHLISVTGKGDKQRMVPVSPEVLSLIKKDYLEGVFLRLIGKNSTDYLFPTVYGGKIQNMSRQSFWLILKKMAQAAGVQRKISPHLLRHSLATHLLRKGANLRLLQMLLGHERLSTVQIYTHVDIDYLRGIYDKRHPRS